jgi:UPF0755 protein
LAVVAVAALAAAFIYPQLARETYFGAPEPVFVEVQRGMGTLRIAGALSDAGVIRSPWQFIAVRLLRPRTHLQAGEYRFAAAASVWDVYGRIARGDVYFEVLRIPEGSNMFDIAALVERARLASARDFLAVAQSPRLIRDLAPGAPSLEGYLSPATYHFPRRTSPADICQALTAHFRKVWAEIGSQADVHATVTLASLVEKEAARADERARVAAVYRNRLEKKMPLDCDPTVIYAALLGGRWTGTILRSDLDRDVAYNTYRRPGLPPGPIANPGEAALRAALSPAATRELYFVAKADGSGGHVFSETYEAHQQAVAGYRRATRQADESTRGAAAKRSPAGQRRVRAKAQR